MEGEIGRQRERESTGRMWSERSERKKGVRQGQQARNKEPQGYKHKANKSRVPARESERKTRKNRE